MQIEKIEEAVLKEAEKSLCKKRKVGAIIMNVDSTTILARGYNYSTKTQSGGGCEDANGNTRPDVVHAEIAAINKLAVTTDCVIYVSHEPCDNCQGAIDAAGLKLVIVNKFIKFDKGKLMYNLIPPKAMKELAKVLTYGAKKYKPNNWQGVDEPNRYIDALYRHLEAWRSGEKIDKESGLSHLSHALTNITFLIHFEDIN